MVHVRTEPHYCHAMNCKRVVPRRLFLCARHWRMLTPAEQAKVWTNYTPGQENDWSKVTPEYLDVTMAVIQRIAESEGVCGDG